MNPDCTCQYCTDKVTFVALIANKEIEKEMEKMPKIALGKHDFPISTKSTEDPIC